MPPLDNKIKKKHKAHKNRAYSLEHNLNYKILIIISGVSKYTFEKELTGILFF